MSDEMQIAQQGIDNIIRIIEAQLAPRVARYWDPTADAIMIQAGFRLAGAPARLPPEWATTYDEDMIAYFFG